ncbi:class I SAM-dependent methyltransferase [Agaribacterium sp. ZY112]|uniref:class I SAM-dependent methyltransferase n=1 Tax=Agaribacterium sp. ZY112 TaxID=3233574 RepID=UPI0035269EFC
MSVSQEFWDKKAGAYAESPIADEESYQRKLSETQALLTPEMSILEFGCGTGTTAIKHAPNVKDILAIDIAQNMLEIGRERAKKAGVDNVVFKRSTLTGLCAKSESLDAVLGLNVMHLVPNRKETLADVARILKPGGIFVSSTVCLGGSYLRFVKLFEPIGKFLGLMPDLFILKESEWEKEIIDAGFTIETQWHHGNNGIAVFIIARKVTT